MLITFFCIVMFAIQILIFMHSFKDTASGAICRIIVYMAAGATFGKVIGDIALLYFK